MSRLRLRLRQRAARRDTFDPNGVEERLDEVATTDDLQAEAEAMGWPGGVTEEDRREP